MSARVLVAADTPMVLGIIAHKLRREGHDVTGVRGPRELAQALRDGRYDCAVCEAALLDEAAVSALPSWLAIVDGRDEEAAVRAMRAGAAGIVRTPFKPTSVAAQVSVLLAIVGAET